jgi:hypothetical protein
LATLWISRVLPTAPLFAHFGPEASYINRTEPVYSCTATASIPTDRNPPAALVNNWMGAVFTLRNIRKTKIYDLAAAMPLVLWYGLGIRGLLPRIGAQSPQHLNSFDALALMAVVSQALTIGFMTIRTSSPRTAVSRVVAANRSHRRLAFLFHVSSCPIGESHAGDSHTRRNSSHSRNGIIDLCKLLAWALVQYLSRRT